MWYDIGIPDAATRIPDRAAQPLHTAGCAGAAKANPGRKGDVLMRGLPYWVYRAVRGLVRLFYKKPTFEGLENLPEGPCVIVGNHAQMNGPIVGEVFLPGPHVVWCTGEMMHLKEVPDYAYRDFWSGKPHAVRWFYRLLSYAIAPLSVCVFNNALCIAVYRDSRITGTFRQTLEALAQGTRVVIFPECAEPHNHVIYEFQDRFIALGRMYHRQYGAPLAFVPMYVAPALGKVCFGRPVYYNPSAEAGMERRRVCDALMDTITELAEAQPRHHVVPYLNLPKKEYPMNRTDEGGNP